MAKSRRNERYMYYIGGISLSNAVNIVLIKSVGIERKVFNVNGKLMSMGAVKSQAPASRNKVGKNTGDDT